MDFTKKRNAPKPVEMINVKPLYGYSMALFFIAK